VLVWLLQHEHRLFLVPILSISFLLTLPVLGRNTSLLEYRIWKTKLTTSSHQNGINLAQILGVLLLVDDIVIRTLHLHFFSTLRSHLFTGLFEKCSEDVAITAVFVEYFVQRCVTL
jgi:hypothetical protein